MTTKPRISYVDLATLDDPKMPAGGRARRCCRVPPRPWRPGSSPRNLPPRPRRHPTTGRSSRSRLHAASRQPS